MRDREKAMTELRLVEAANETEAEEKFTNHFRSKGSSNDDSYSVDSIKVDAPIV